ncbi:MAG: PaaI family thioesterase [Desulforudis sp.]|nr:MAG: PaaI family thioesterase [Desulforudis sp.]
MAERVPPHMCFACSPNNPIGLKLQFEDVGDTLRTSFTPREEHQGWPGWTHGGLVTTVLDEAMAQWVWRREITAMTADLSIRFRHGLPLGETLRVEARRVSARGCLLELEAEGKLDDGTVIAQAKAKFMIVTRETVARG